MTVAATRVTAAATGSSLSRLQRVLVAVVAVLTVAFVAVVGVALAGSGGGRTYAFVIPDGASALLADAQDIPGGPPDTLSLRLGDTLEIENRDSVGHTYGFLVLEPGETGRYTFNTKGTFRGACTFGDHEEVVITVG